MYAFLVSYIHVQPSQRPAVR